GLCGIVILLLLYSLGDKTPIHFWFYHLPFFSSFRVPGRFMLAVPFFLVCILAWLFSRNKISWPHLLAGALILSLSSLFGFGDPAPEFSPLRASHLPASMDLLEPVIAGGILIATICLWSFRRFASLAWTFILMGSVAYSTLF